MIRGSRPDGRPADWTTSLLAPCICRPPCYVYLLPGLSHVAPPDSVSLQLRTLPGLIVIEMPERGPLFSLSYTVRAYFLQSHVWDVLVGRGVLLS